MIDLTKPALNKETTRKSSNNLCDHDHWQTTYQLLPPKFVIAPIGFIPPTGNALALAKLN
jgi:hypothetical protein